MIEKVINGLECAIQYGPHYCGGEFGDENEYSRIGQNVLMDALVLLKAQEPVKPLKMAVDHVRKEPVVFSYECPVCMCGLQRHWVACPICGIGVKFE